LSDGAGEEAPMDLRDTGLSEKKEAVGAEDLHYRDRERENMDLKQLK